MADKAQPRPKRVPTPEEMKIQAQKDLILMKLHAHFQEIEGVLNHKVYSTERAEHTRRLVACARYEAIKTYMSDYADTPTTAGDLGI